MCGHGTICLVTEMLNHEIFQWHKKNSLKINLQLPKKTTAVEVFRNSEGKAQVMLDITPPTFSKSRSDISRLADLLSINPNDFERTLPLEMALGDFNHLVLPFKNLASISSIEPDYTGLVDFCRQFDIQTLACFTTEAQNDSCDLHVRDFCPAVGANESAATGTTNAALSAYLFRHRRCQISADGFVHIRSEQGLEMNRPSTIHSILHTSEKTINRIQVGGVAVKTISGQLHLNDYEDQPF